MRSRFAAFNEYLTYTLLLWVLLTFVVFRVVVGRNVVAEAGIALLLASLLGYGIYDYSTSRLPGRATDEE